LGDLVAWRWRTCAGVDGLVAVLAAPVPADGNAPLPDELLVAARRKPMKKLTAVAAFALMVGTAFAQNAGPAPQSGMEKPGMTDGAKPDGSMDTTGMSSTKGNIKRDKDGAPAPMKQDGTRK
jgi:hypothetical protein